MTTTTKPDVEKLRDITSQFSSLIAELDDVASSLAPHPHMPGLHAEASTPPANFFWLLSAEVTDIRRRLVAEFE